MGDDLFRKFLAEQSRDLGGRSDEYVARSVAPSWATVSGLAMMIGSWEEDGVEVDTEADWGRVFASHVDSNLVQAAAMAFAARSRMGASAAVTGETRKLSQWMWSVAHNRPFAVPDPASEGTDPGEVLDHWMRPVKSLLPAFWAIDWSVLLWIQGEGDQAEAEWQDRR